MHATPRMDKMSARVDPRSTSRSPRICLHTSGVVVVCLPRFPPRSAYGPSSSLAVTASIFFFFGSYRLHLPPRYAIAQKKFNHNKYPASPCRTPHSTLTLNQMIVVSPNTDCQPVRQSTLHHSRRPFSTQKEQHWGYEAPATRALCQRRSQPDNPVRA